MSVFTDFVPAILQINIQEQGLSGAPKKTWIDVSEIEVSIYDNDAFKSSQSVKYEQSTHMDVHFTRILFLEKNIA